MSVPQNIIGYMKRFKQSRDVLKSHIGGDILKFIENLPAEMARPFFRNRCFIGDRESRVQSHKRHTVSVPQNKRTQGLHSLSYDERSEQVLQVP